MYEHGGNTLQSGEKGYSMREQEMFLSKLRNPPVARPSPWIDNLGESYSTSLRWLLFFHGNFFIIILPGFSGDENKKGFKGYQPAVELEDTEVGRCSLLQFPVRLLFLNISFVNLLK